jgi:hypothetical protein
MGSFRLAHVEGTAALFAGLGYIALAMFSALSVGDPPPENHSWVRRIARFTVRWTSLISGFWAWHVANVSVHASAAWDLSLKDDLWVLLPVMSCFGIVAVLGLLWAMFQREAVKRELRHNDCRPLHIWWRPAAYWAPAWFGKTPFRVVYRDPVGLLHKAYCYSSTRSFSGFGSCYVRWLKDEVAGEPVASEVWMSPEVVRAKPRKT